MIKKKKMVVTIFMVLLFLFPIYIITLPYTWIFQIILIDKVQSLLPKPCFYIRDIFGAFLMDRETGQVIDDNIKASLTKDHVIYVLGNYGFYVADTKNEVIKIFTIDKDKSYSYKENHYIQTGKDNVQILIDEDLTMEEREVMSKLINAAYSETGNLDSDVDVYMWRR